MPWYTRRQGRSPIGPFCDWVKIVDKAFPTISVPPDPLDGDENIGLPEISDRGKQAFFDKGDSLGDRFSCRLQGLICLGQAQNRMRLPPPLSKSGWFVGGGGIPFIRTA